jgi:phosphoribosyl-ATP pyrophosphohydrolase/phosphoribosyl-AMP cyclohydrolase
MEIEKGLLAQLKYNEDGLIPAIVQDVSTGQVLMLAYMNELSLKKTLQSGKAYFYSRSRKKLWLKGETSGHTQEVKQIVLDCDGDTLLLKVKQKGVACHTGSYSCFYRNLAGKETSSFEQKEDNNDREDKDKGIEKINILEELTKVFEERKMNPRSDSYVCYLMASPGEKIPKKIAEEAAEVLIALKIRIKTRLFMKLLIYAFIPWWHCAIMVYPTRLF